MAPPLAPTDGCRAVTNPFYHDAPLIRRADVSLAAELQSEPAGDRPAQPGRGRKAARLHARNFGHALSRAARVHLWRSGSRDPRRASAAASRSSFLGVPAEHRLPLRAYHAGMFFKNGVPIGYIECLTLFEHMEVGFNLYYTFREGETAWLYARLLRLFRQLLDVTCFAVDPYQIGQSQRRSHRFRRVLVLSQARISSGEPAGGPAFAASKNRSCVPIPAYRTPAAHLRRLADGWMIYESAGARHGDWDHFETRRAAMALHRSPFPPAIQRAKNAAEESTYVRALQRDPASPPAHSQAGFAIIRHLR